ERCFGWNRQTSPGCEIWFGDLYASVIRNYEIQITHISSSGAKRVLMADLYGADISGHWSSVPQPALQEEYARSTYWVSVLRFSMQSSAAMKAFSICGNWVYATIRRVPTRGLNE